MKNMTTKKEIKQIVKEINRLCAKDRYGEAGNLAKINKGKFIAMIKSGGAKSLNYAYKTCDVFNMTHSDCMALIF